MNRNIDLETSNAAHSPLRRRVTMGAIVALGAATIALARVMTATSDWSPTASTISAMSPSRRSRRRTEKGAARRSRRRACAH